MSTVIKTLRLNKSPLSTEAISAIAAMTLSNGDFVAAEPIAPEIGDKMRDGTIYAGISPETSKPMYAKPADVPLTATFNQTLKYAEWANADKEYGHDDWRVPTKSELNVLFNNRAAIGGFNMSCSDTSGSYWSSSCDSNAWCQRFSDGLQHYGNKIHHSSVRLLR